MFLQNFAKYAFLVFFVISTLFFSKEIITINNKLNKVNSDFDKYRLNSTMVVANDDDGYPVVLNPKDGVVAKKFIISGGKWEPNVRRVIRNVVMPGQKVVVLGSHVGVHLMLISRLVENSGRIYAFEPNTETLKFLKKNIENNPIKNITLYEKAAYSSNTKLKFLEINQFVNPGASYIIKEVNHDSFAGKEVEVEAVALDSVLPSNISIDVIQMDVEGAEADAIFGAEHIIDASPNLVVIQEWTPKWMKKDVEKYLSFWRKRGYKFARIADDDLHEMSDEDLTNSDQADIVILKDLESLKRKIFSK